MLDKVKGKRKKDKDEKKVIEDVLSKLNQQLNSTALDLKGFRGDVDA